MLVATEAKGQHVMSRARRNLAAAFAEGTQDSVTSTPRRGPLGRPKKSCTSCAQHKKRCDGQVPCGNCMRKLGCSSAVDTPPCSLERAGAEHQPAGDSGTLETQGSETERLKSAIRQLGCLVEAAVADAAHRNQATFIDQVHKHEADAELVLRLYNAMRTTKPHMYRRL